MGKHTANQAAWKWLGWEQSEGTRLWCRGSEAVESPPDYAHDFSLIQRDIIPALDEHHISVSLARQRGERPQNGLWTTRLEGNGFSAQPRGDWGCSTNPAMSFLVSLEEYLRAFRPDLFRENSSPSAPSEPLGDYGQDAPIEEDGALLDVSEASTPGLPIRIERLNVAQCNEER